jgi:hypothetical protein
MSVTSARDKEDRAEEIRSFQRQGRQRQVYWHTSVGSSRGKEKRDGCSGIDSLWHSFGRETTPAEICVGTTIFIGTTETTKPKISALAI